MRQPDESGCLILFLLPIAFIIGFFNNKASVFGLMRLSFDRITLILYLYRMTRFYVQSVQVVYKEWID